MNVVEYVMVCDSCPSIFAEADDAERHERDHFGHAATIVERLADFA